MTPNSNFDLNFTLKRPSLCGVKQQNGNFVCKFYDKKNFPDSSFYCLLLRATENTCFSLLRRYASVRVCVWFFFIWCGVIERQLSSSRSSTLVNGNIVCMYVERVWYGCCFLFFYFMQKYNAHTLTQFSHSNTHIRRCVRLKA